MAELKSWIAGNRPDRPPRGALIVIAVGLVATFAAAVLANENLAGDASNLEYVQTRDLPDSESVPIPGGGEMQLTDAGLAATGTNVSGYNLFRSTATLTIAAGSPVGRARILCSMRAPGGTEVAQTTNLRASYPRSSEENLMDQETYDTALVEFASKGSGLAVLDMEDLPDLWATEKGIKLEWPTYGVGIERWHYFLPPGSPAKDLVLPFATIWRATKIPAIEIACKVTTSGGTGTVKTSGAMGRLPETIAE